MAPVEEEAVAAVKAERNRLHHDFFMNHFDTSPHLARGRAVEAPRLLNR